MHSMPNFSKDKVIADSLELYAIIDLTLSSIPDMEEEGEGRG